MPPVLQQPAAKGRPKGSKNKVTQEAIVGHDIPPDTAALFALLAKGAAPHQSPARVTRSGTPPPIVMPHNIPVPPELQQNVTLRSKRVKRGWLWTLVGLLWKLPSSKMFFVSMMFFGWSCMSPSVVNSSARLLATSASFAETVGPAAADLLSSGANLTSTLCRVVELSLTTTSGLLSRAWVGVDLAKIKVAVQQGTLVVDDHNAFLLWVATSDGAKAAGWPIDMIEQSAVAFDTLSYSRPVVEDYSTVFDPEKHLLEYRIRLSILPSGWIAVQWALTTARFTPRWSNPLWELANISFHTVHNEVRYILLKVVQQADMSPTLDRTGWDIPVLVSFRTLLGRAQLWVWAHAWAWICPPCLWPSPVSTWYDYGWLLAVLGGLLFVYMLAYFHLWECVGTTGRT